MRIPANSAQAIEKREVVPEGTYLCKVLDVQIKAGTKGDYWSLKLEIQEGEYDGRFIFDNLFFSPKALNRFFLVFKRLTGIELDQSKDLDVDESDLLGCKANVTVVHKEEEYKGERITKVVVPYDGYESLDPNYKHEVPKKKAKVKETNNVENDLEDIPF